MNVLTSSLVIMEVLNIKVSIFLLRCLVSVDIPSVFLFSNTIFSALGLATSLKDRLGLPGVVCPEATPGFL